MVCCPLKGETNDAASGGYANNRFRRVLDRNQPLDAECIAGYEVYALDCTGNPAAEAKTLPDRSRTKQGRYASTEVGVKTLGSRQSQPGPARYQAQSRKGF